MSEGINEAVQIIKVSIEGVEVVFRTGAMTLKGAWTMLAAAYHAIKREKLAGKTKMIKLLQKGGDLQVFRFEEGKMEEVRKWAKKYGILYSELADLNKGDGYTEIIFHSEATPRVNAMIERLGYGSIITKEQYVDNADEKEAEELRHEMEEELGLGGKKERAARNAAKNDEPIREKTEEELKKTKKQMEYHAKRNDEGYREITINESLVVDKSNGQYKTRIPGKKDQYIWIKEEDIYIRDGGKTINTFLEKERYYHIVDKDNQIIEQIKGVEFQKNYDRVSREFTKQRRANANQKRKKKTATKKAGVKL